MNIEQKNRQSPTKYMKEGRKKKEEDIPKIGGANIVENKATIFQGEMAQPFTDIEKAVESERKTRDRKVSSECKLN